MYAQYFTCVNWCVTYILKQQHQVGAQISEAASDFKAIIDELNDQVQSYLGLLDEKDNRIKKVIYALTFQVYI